MTKREKYQELYRKRNRLKRNRYQKKYYQQNREHCLEKAHKIYERDKKRILAKMRKYYAANRATIKKRNRDAWFRKPVGERRVISRTRQVKHMYNLTSDKHIALLEKQRYKCPISGEPVNIFSSIDHDHRCCPREKSCGECIRGILSRRINAALDAFLNPRWFLKAHKYVTA
jgi:Recombination endonuclease VII